MKKSRASAFFERTVNPAIEKFVDKNLDIAVQTSDYLTELGWTQKDFAKKLGKSEAEISKWLSGTHNLTLKSITKMEAVLGKDIIITKRQLEKEKAAKSFQIRAKANSSTSALNTLTYPNYEQKGRVIPINIKNNGNQIYGHIGH